MRKMKLFIFYCDGTQIKISDAYNLVYMVLHGFKQIDRIVIAEFEDGSSVPVIEKQFVLAE